MRLRYLMSISVHFLQGWGLSVNFCQDSVPLGDLPSIFCAAGKHSVTFRQLSVQPKELP